LATLAPQFERLFRHFPKQWGGHEAREVSWRLDSFANGLWTSRLRLPRQQQ
jgi:hypothetical protein